MEMLISLAGTMVGAMVGVATMCLLQIKKVGDTIVEIRAGP